MHTRSHAAPALRRSFRFLRCLAAGSAALALAQAAGAQQPPVYEGGETVVTGGRIPQKLSDALRSVVVITASQIEASGQLTLGEVLQLYGGVEMASNGGPGSPVAIFMRGANSTHTLVMLDGMRLQSATSGTTAFENIPPSQIERIEIVPGPVSGLYGSDAIGGVIQIFTKSGRYSPGASVSAAVGSYGTRSLDASFTGARERTEYAVSAAHVQTDGFSATNPGVPFGQYNPDDDGYRNASLSAKVLHHFDASNELGAAALYSRGSAHFDDGPANDSHTDQGLTTWSIHSRNQLTGAWESLLRVGSSRDDSTSFAAFPGAFRTDENQALWQNTYRLGGAALVAGAEYLGQEVAASADFTTTKRTIRSIFAGVTGDYGDHGIQANVRRDDNSQFGAPTSGSVAYGYRFAPGARARLAYGKAFHAPTFNDLYYPGFSNPALVPEQSRNREVGLDYEAGTQRIAATYFDNRISDLIVFVFDPVTFEGAPVNLAKARIHGLELSYRGRWLGTWVRAQLTVQDPRSEPDGLLLQRRAKRHASVSATRDTGPWRFGVELYANGERFDSADESPASRMHGYALVNLTAERRLGNDWSIALRWNNVGDTKYELAQGFNTPGSNVLLTVKWTPQ